MKSLKNSPDVTERQRADPTTATLAAIVNFSDDAIISKDLNGVITSWNRSAERLFGYTAKEAIGKPITILIPPERLHEETEILAQLKRGGRVDHFETVRLRKDGSQLDISLTISPIVDSTGLIIGASKIARDITDRKRMETELLAWKGNLESRVAEQRAQLLAEAEVRKRLEAAIAGAVEREQERLGQELHDGLAQELTGIGMMLDVLADTLMERSPTQGREASRLRLMLAKATASTRDLAKNFYPVALEKHGLLLALQELAKYNQERFGIFCAVKARKNPFTHLKDARAIQLYRIAQEAIHNAAKHSQAKHIYIDLTTQEGNWILTVKDDGVGLQRDPQQANGIGLRIMQYRANMIGGTIRVRNDDGGGVIVSCAVPAVQTAADQIRTVQKKISLHVETKVKPNSAASGH